MTFKTKTFYLTSLLVLMSGCAEQPTLTEQNFGKSVRQMVSAQKYQQTINPNPVEGIDGQQAEEVMQIYRTSVAKPQQVQRDVQINVGE